MSLSQKFFGKLFSLLRVKKIQNYGTIIHQKQLNCFVLAKESSALDFLNIS